MLGPVLFLLYTAEVLNIIQRHGLRLVGHSYADDSSIYLHLDRALCCAHLPTVTACIDDISSWMFSNRLMINMDKTQLFGWVRLSSWPSSPFVRLLRPMLTLKYLMKSPVSVLFSIAL